MYIHLIMNHISNIMCMYIYNIIYNNNNDNNNNIYILLMLKATPPYMSHRFSACRGAVDTDLTKA